MHDTYFTWFRSATVLLRILFAIFHQKMKIIMQKLLISGWHLINYNISCSLASVQPLAFAPSFTSFRGKNVGSGGGVL